MRMNTLISVLLTIIFLTTGCVTSGTNNYPLHPTLQKSQLPDLIPLRDFFVNTDFENGHKVSPDGKKMAWIATKNKRRTIHFKTIGEDKVEAISAKYFRNIPFFRWAQDSRHLFIHGHRYGNEYLRIYMFDTKYPLAEEKELIMFQQEEIRSQIYKIPRFDKKNVFVTHNQRDRNYYDLYQTNIETFETKLVDKNPGNIISWVIDEEGNLRARIRSDESLKTEHLEIFQSDKESWKEIISWDMETKVTVVGFTTDNKGMWLKSNSGRDKIGLSCLNLETGEESLYFETEKCDLSDVVISLRNKQPMIGYSYPDYQEIHFFDTDLREDFNCFKGEARVGIRILSRDNKEEKFTVMVYGDWGSEYYLYDRVKKEKSLLSQDPYIKIKNRLVRMEPISFESRDGLTIHGYLSLPRIESPKLLPTIVLVHGGPWSRDYWGYDSEVQFLANRGYAVLQVNFRGSSGYGRAFQEAAVNEFAGKMHDDVVDGVNWLIKKEIADPEKIGICGTSYGGYEALVGLAFSPYLFSCGVDVCGPTNLSKFLETVPKYWKSYMPLWYKYVGKPDNPASRGRIDAKSPYFHVNEIKSPVLIVHGYNDPRVDRKYVKEMVSALKKADKKVDFLEFVDEGHGIYGWRNRMEFYRKLEEFFAEYLGGRCGGFEFSQWKS